MTMKKMSVSFVAQRPDLTTLLAKTSFPIIDKSWRFVQLCLVRHFCKSFIISSSLSSEILN